MSVREKWEAIYNAARYEVMLEDDSLLFTIGLYDADAEQRLIRETEMQRDWTIITPCNPRSDLAREELNLFYFNELRDELEDRAGFWFKALNRDPSGQFPDEPGFCVIDADREWIMNLGRRFYQNALVTAAIGSAPRLLWLDK